MLPSGYLEFEMDRSTSFAPLLDETVDAEIILSKMHEDEGEEFLEVAFMTATAVQLDEWYAVTSSRNDEEQKNGQREIASLLAAVGTGGVNDHNDLLNKWVKLVRRGSSCRVRTMNSRPHDYTLRIVATNQCIILSQGLQI